MTSSQRRKEITEYLSSVRVSTIPKLAVRFGVSESTMKRDIRSLKEQYIPIDYHSGNGGGIRLMDGWYASRTYLTPAEEELLRSLAVSLPAEKKMLMDNILLKFAIPKNTA